MIRTIPLNKLVPSSRNVRRASDEQAGLQLEVGLFVAGPPHIARRRHQLAERYGPDHGMSPVEPVRPLRTPSLNRRSLPLL